MSSPFPRSTVGQRTFSATAFQYIPCLASNFSMQLPSLPDLPLVLNTRNLFYKHGKNRLYGIAFTKLADFRVALPVLREILILFVRKLLLENDSPRTRSYAVVPCYNVVTVFFYKHFSRITFLELLFFFFSKITFTELFFY